jgi:deoxyribodipyrimidine photo-lyase
MFEAWKSGKTGFLLSDAGMREMNATGHMHGRVRMLSATLLSRILQVDWTKGESYFAGKLADYNFINNRMNWFWILGTETFSQDYYRVMNEFSQIEKVDCGFVYIKKWIPEINFLENDILRKYVKSIL